MVYFLVGTVALGFLVLILLLRKNSEKLSKTYDLVGLFFVVAPAVLIVCLLAGYGLGRLFLPLVTLG
jgi:small-conductance mechanosensitive channel